MTIEERARECAERMSEFEEMRIVLANNIAQAIAVAVEEERAPAITALRGMCATLGLPDDWPEETRLADIINNYIVAYWPTTGAAIQANVEKEREACAKVVENCQWSGELAPVAEAVTLQLVAAIRARSTTSPADTAPPASAPSSEDR